MLQSPWYRDLFPSTRLLGANPGAGDFSTTRQGGRLAVSAGGPITGRGAELIIIDDPLKASDAASDVERTRINQWFDQNIVQRLDNKATGAIILVMQRLHDEDVTGYLLEKGGWEHLRLPAIAEALPHFIEQVYNANRLHSALGYRSPVNFEEEFARQSVQSATA